MDQLVTSPEIVMAKNALTEEQKEEYKKIGEYMYQTDVSKVKHNGSQVVKVNKADLLIYAESGLRSGLSPKDLTADELASLINAYGERWFERFDISEEEANLVPKMCRQQRRELERQAKKKEKRGNK